MQERKKRLKVRHIKYAERLSNHLVYRTTGASSSGAMDTLLEFALLCWNSPILSLVLTPSLIIVLVLFGGRVVVVVVDVLDGGARGLIVLSTLLGMDGVVGTSASLDLEIDVNSFM
jgi:hypothetical protein